MLLAKLSRTALLIVILVCSDAVALAADPPEALAEKVSDQAAFNDLGARVLKAIESGDRDAFAKSVLIVPGEMEEVFALLPDELREKMPENRRPGSEEFDKMITAQLDGSANTFSELMSLANEHGIDLTGSFELAGVEPDTIRVQGRFPTSDLMPFAASPPPTSLTNRACALGTGKGL
jgi:hypothetical protein